MENMILNGVPTGDISIDITPVKRAQMLQQQATGKQLLKTLSNATMANNSLYQTAAGSGSNTTKTRTINNLNARSGDINNSN